MKTLLWTICLAATIFIAQASAQDEEYRRNYSDSVNCEKNGDYDGAIKYMLAIRTSPTNTYYVNVRLGWLYYSAAKYADARVAYQNAIRLNATSLEAKIGYVNVLLALGRWDEAEFQCKQVIKTDTNNYYANLKLCYSLRMQKKGASAEKLANEMLALYPSDVSFQVELGFSYLLQNNNTAAKRVFGDVLMFNPDNYWAKEQMGKL